MSTRSCPRLAGLIFAMIAGIAWTATAQSINPGAVTLNQIDFRGGPNSVVGEITIHYALAGGSGFVNVLNPSVPSDSGWLVRNLPVFDPTTGYDHGSITTRMDLTQFAGANGVDVTSVSLIIDYNPSPSATRSQVESHGASLNIFPVGSVKVAIGGTGPGGEVTGYQAPPSLIDVQFTVLGIPSELIYQLKHPNIQAGRNQCAPAAVANSLQFLENTILLSIPHLNLPGWGGDVPNTTLVGQLDVKTGRQLGPDRSAAGNGGVWPMDGKLSYVAMNRLAPFLRIKHRVNGKANNLGTPLSGGADYTHMGVTSHGEGASFDIDWILQELEDGEDVEMDLHYHPTEGRHYVDVVGGGRVLGLPFLLHVSDKQQSDEDPGDNQGTGDVDFEWIKNATGFAANSNAFVDQIISQSVIAEVDYFPDTSGVFELSGPSGIDRVMMRGPSTVLVAVGLNGEAVDSDNDGRDQVQTQMVQLDLNGTSALFGPLTLRLRDPAKAPFRVSGGKIEETANTMTGRLDLPPFAPSGTAFSFFKIYFEVTVQTPFGPLLLHNQDPKLVKTTISHKPPEPGGVYEDPRSIPLYLEDGSSSGYQITSTRHVPRLELAPPTCTLTWVANGVDATIMDSGGLFRIEVTRQENAEVNVPGFLLGSHGPVVVTARKQTPGVPSVVELKVTDTSGNMITCDPVLTLQVREDGKPVSETLSSIPQAERLVTVRNGSPGLKNLHVTVNGKAFVLSGLRDSEERTLDITSALQPGNGNVIVLTAHGKPGGSADVAIHD